MRAPVALNALFRGFPNPSINQKRPICMFALTDAQHRRCLMVMVAFHIAIIAASNYLVQLPFTLFGFHTTWGAFSFPFIFLATDLTVRLFGKGPARTIILRVMFPALLVSYVVSVIFPRGSFAGIEALGEWNLFVARIAVASFLAYVLGQLLDVQVFDRLRQWAWWVAPVCSTILAILPIRLPSLPPPSITVLTPLWLSTG